ncbi:MAG: DUF5667 domain-containing protein [Actinomycetota bacterium]
MKLNKDEQAFADLLEGLRADAPREMAKMAHLAQALEHVRSTTGPSPAFRNQLRNRVLAEAALRRSWIERVAERWAERNAAFKRSFRFVFATGVAALMLLTSGAMFAVADTAVPGDWDYGIKRLHENARLLITRGAEPRAYLQMELARERIDEIRELQNRGTEDPALYRIAFNDMDARTQDATELIVGVFRDTSRKLPLQRLTNFAIAQRNALEVLVDELPPAVRPSANSSMELLQAVSQRLTGIQAGCLCPANPLLPNTSSGSSASGNSGTPTGADEQGCSCSRFRSEGTTDIGDGTTGPSAGNGNQKPPGPIGPGVGVNPPDLIPGDDPVEDVTDVVNNLIDDTLNGAGDILEPLEPITNLPSGLLGN